MSSIIADGSSSTSAAGRAPRWDPSRAINDPAGQSWAYPNYDSYRSMGRDGLEHGYIFRVTMSDGSLGPPSTIDPRAGKKFQFNPASIRLSVGTEEVDGEDTEAPGSNVPGVAFGNSTMSFSMMFDRSIETAQATRGKGGPEMSLFKDIGVAKDVFDVYEVITGRAAEGFADDDIFAGPAVANRPRSIRDMSKSFFDLSAVGIEMRLRPVAMVFNTNFAFYGQLLNFGVNFLKFNANLVPLTVNVDMTLKIVQANSVQGIRDLISAGVEAQSNADRVGWWWGPFVTGGGSGSGSPANDPALPASDATRIIDDPSSSIGIDSDGNPVFPIKVD